ncbi:phosphoglycerate kinase [archaeon]|nr:MAG: phosphoglycerate kinase [archaeon]
MLAKEKPGLLNNAKVLVRVDFNVPQSKKDPNVITDDTRIREALPTINFLTNSGAKVMLVSHSGRPKAQVVETMRMAPMAKRLSELINKPVTAVKDCVGEEVDKAVNAMKAGDVIMLENARFYKEEEKNSPEFAQKLAKNADVYVNDAFGTAHRAHASTEGVTKFVPHKVAGFLMEKEIKFLKGAVDSPKRPFAAVVGGAKVSTKIPVIESLIQKCDKIFIGGGMIFTFYRAQGLSVGKSMVEEEFITMAKDLMEKANKKGVKFFLPTDVVIANDFKADAEDKVVSSKDIPEGWMGLDIGPDSVNLFRKELLDCNTIVWNGPMGVFEFEKFAKGTFAVAHALADVTAKGGITIIGGGDSVAAVSAAKLNDKMSHISTGGGASLEMLEGLELPGVAALDNA